jgi:hypothetical protein
METVVTEVGVEIKPNPQKEMAAHLARLDMLATDPEHAEETFFGCTFASRALGGNIEGISRNDALLFSANYLRKLYGIDLQTKNRHNLNSQITIIEEKLADSLTNIHLTKENVGAYLTTLESIFSSDRWSFPKHEAARLVALNHFRLSKLAKGDLTERYNALLGNPNFYGTLGNFFSDVYEPKKWNQYQQNKALLDRILARLGIEGDTETFINAWSEENDGEYKIDSKNNLNAIAELETVRPGASKLLHDFYGIRAFARYPTQMLIDQYDNHGKTDKPYGITVTAIEDHNGAFGASKSDAGRPYRGLRDHFYTRAIEAKNKIELGKNLLKLKSLYGDAQKIQFVFLQAHGEPDGFMLGNYGLFSHIGEISLTTQIGNNTRQLFTEKPVIVLASCSTGAENGIAQKLSRDLYATVIGPEEQSELTEMIVVNTPAGIKMVPAFAKTKSDRREDMLTRIPVRANLYINGELVKGDAYDEYFAELKTAA